MTVNNVTDASQDKPSSETAMGSSIASGQTRPSAISGGEDPSNESKLSSRLNSLNESGQLHSRSDLRFPHPTERPDSIVVIFDGKCKFCTKQVRILQRLDFAKRLSFVSLHDVHVADWWPELSYDDLMKQIYVIPPVCNVTGQVDLKRVGGEKYGGAEGFRYIAWRLPILWPAALILSIPFSLPLWKRIYDFIATQRYRFGKLGDDCGPDGTCEIHYGNKQPPKT